MTADGRRDLTRRLKGYKINRKTRYRAFCVCNDPSHSFTSAKNVTRGEIRRIGRICEKRHDTETPCGMLLAWHGFINLRRHSPASNSRKHENLSQLYVRAGKDISSRWYTSIHLTHPLPPPWPLVGIVNCEAKQGAVIKVCCIKWQINLCLVGV